MPDLKEFTRVINEHHSSLRYYIQGLGVNPAWVDDMAQDAFLVAYRKWGEFEAVENPGAWLRSIAKNLVLNETAKLNRRQRLLDENLTTLMLESSDDDLEAGGLSDLSHRQDALRACMKKLSEKARGIVEARYFHDRNSAEIGDEFSMKPVAVRKMLFHSRQALAHCLKGSIESTI
ncbi:sigma-70 family RNA polymerase sigma factor [Luteolibacter luteus]|uniref:Sigma-70 family RNA polymerase sigma factor n=1 Tax=Luteolibacter luteus TaxID=2728835 RepID=A0A858RIT0_9BACT|nr:sigma-70 family RNA polymerase sigma factor [Luteolibacter luteus]QJE96329.1 sigma-70 family RNA polymerase sigma factor [Luteolibacter luteus]